MLWMASPTAGSWFAPPTLGMQRPAVWLAWRPAYLLPAALPCSAYKLGKRRWSYNQVELVLCEAGEGGRMLSVKQAVNTGTDNFKEEVRVSCRVGFGLEQGVKEGEGNRQGLRDQPA